MIDVGLRERKKRETHRTLAGAARRLVHERGLEAVTIDEIAEAAGVSVRTFFNYFSCKEEAIVGVEPRVLAELADDLRSRPADEAPLTAVRAVLNLDGDPDLLVSGWQLRNALVETYPQLLPRHLAALVEVESTLAGALADRLGVDARSDPFPRLFVAAVLAVVRAAFAWWESSARDEPLTAVVDRGLACIDPGPVCRR